MRHYGFQAEKTYISWIKYYILFHGKRHSQNMGKVEIGEFLTNLAVNRNASKIKLFEKVLEISIKNQNICAKEKIHISVILTKDEVKTIIFNTSGNYQLMLKLLWLWFAHE